MVEILNVRMPGKSSHNSAHLCLSVHSCTSGVEKVN